MRLNKFKIKILNVNLRLARKEKSSHDFYFFLLKIVKVNENKIICN